MKKAIRAGYVVLPLLAAAVVGILCRHGIGTTDDTPAYYLAAERLSVQTLPYHYPPLYPVLLALARLITGRLPSAACWLNVLAFAATMIILLAGLRRAAGIAEGEVLLVGAVALFSYSALSNYAHAMSEGLFFPLVLTTVFALVAYARRGGGGSLALLAGLAAGVSVWVRYVGVALIPFGVVVLLWFQKGRLKLAFRDVLLFVMVAGGVASSLFVFNVVRGGMASDYGFAVNPVSALKRDQLATALVEYLLPYRVAALFGAGGVGALAMLAIAVWGCVSWLAWKRVGQTLLVLWAFCLVYLAVVWLAMIFSDAMVPLDHRILGPFGLVLTVAVAMASMAGAGDNQGLRRAVCLIVLAVLCATTFVRGARFLAAGWRDGIGYSHAAWRQSALLDWVTREQKHVKFYSNAPAAPYLARGGGFLEWVPWRKNAHNLRDNPRYREEMHQMAEDLRSCKALVVLFKAKHWRECDYPDYLTTPGEILAMDGICLLRDLPDGMLLGACGDACPERLESLPLL